MFQRYGTKNGMGKNKPLKDLIKVVAVDQLLADEKRALTLENIRALALLDETRFRTLGETLISQLSNYTQLLPDSLNSYYAQPGGLFDRALQRTEAALELFKQFLIADNEGKYSDEQRSWQYALFSAALLQGIGKLQTDYEVDLYDNNGQFLKQWNPVLENLSLESSYYFYKLESEQDLDFRKRLNLLLAHTLMPAAGFTLIASKNEILRVWLALLNEDYYAAGALGAILKRADALALQYYFSQQHIRNYANRGSRFGRMSTFSGSVENQDRGQMGIDFLQWLNKALENSKVVINKAPLFHVPAGLLMCAEIFQLFIRENPTYKNWQAVQKSFLGLGLHYTQTNGETDCRYEQGGTQKMVSGIVFKDFGIVLPTKVNVYNQTNGKTQSLSALELMHQDQFNMQLHSNHGSGKSEPLPKLNSDGEWTMPSAIRSKPSVGLSSR